MSLDRDGGREWWDIDFNRFEFESLVVEDLEYLEDVRKIAENL